MDESYIHSVLFDLDESTATSLSPQGVKHYEQLSGGSELLVRIAGDGMEAIAFEHPSQV